MKIQDLDKIYVIHYIKLKERREYLEKRLKQLGLEDYVVWILSLKDGNFTKKELSLHDGSEAAIEERKRILGSQLPPIGKIDMIMMLQHIQVLKKIEKRKNNKISMIFEDDVLLSDDFPKKLESAISSLNKIKWDICYSDRGSLFVDPKVDKNRPSGINLYKPLDKRANTTGSYMITPKSASKLLKLLKKISLGPDMELSYVQKKYNLDVYWTVPFLTRQGSIEEIYASNVRKGSLTGALLKINRTIEKISPNAGQIFSILSDKFRNAVYRSKLLTNLKDLVKSFTGY